MDAKTTIRPNNVGLTEGDEVDWARYEQALANNATSREALRLATRTPAPPPAPEPAPPIPPIRRKSKPKPRRPRRRLIGDEGLLGCLLPWLLFLALALLIGYGPMILGIISLIKSW